MKQGMIIALVIVAILVAAGYVFSGDLISWFFRPTESTLVSENASSEPEVVASSLVTPWSITFLPDGDMLVTEREGRLIRIGENNTRFNIEGVEETSEGGLLGVALAPDFANSNELYVYYTTNRTGTLTNQVDRYRLAGNELVDRQEVIANIPAASNHNGGAIAFGPDEKLYITTGDAARANLAQDTDSLAGKILRLNPDGSVPEDNPFGNAVWSYGHRNPQGIAWDEDGQLWSVEHGPSGMQSGRDELNRIERGENYGWLVITGDEVREGMQAPIMQSGDSETWAPSGLAYLDGHLYFAGLRGQSLYRVDISDPENVTLVRLFAGEYGRLRAVTEHDGSIYFSTSNRDGRGNPSAEDDRIIRVF